MISIRCLVSKWERLREEWCRKSSVNFTFFDTHKITEGVGKTLSGRTELTVRPNLWCTFYGRQTICGRVVENLTNFRRHYVTLWPWPLIPWPWTFAVGPHRVTTHQFGDRCFATAGPNAVEQSAWTASATGHHLRTIQTIFENIYVWLVGPRRPVSER